MAVYFFYGDEDFNIEQHIDKMKAELNPDFMSMNYQTFDNPDYQTLISAIRTPPMMFGKMLVVISADSYFSSQKKAFEDNELSDIENSLSNNPDTLDIVFVVKLPRDENKKIDTRRKLYKILSKYKLLEFPTFKTCKTAEILAWLKNYAKGIGIEYKEDAALFLIDQIGNNLRQFAAESDKLKLLAYPSKVITKQMVENICVSNQDLFNLTELILNGEKDKALLEFQKLLDKKHPLEIISALLTIIRKWIILKIKSQETSTFELSKTVGMHEYAVKQTLKKLKKSSVAELVKLKQNLFNVEYKIKNAELTDIVSEVECAIIR